MSRLIKAYYERALHAVHYCVTKGKLPMFEDSIRHIVSEKFGEYHLRMRIFSEQDNEEDTDVSCDLYISIQVLHVPTHTFIYDTNNNPYDMTPDKIMRTIGSIMDDIIDLAKIPIMICKDCEEDKPFENGLCRRCYSYAMIQNEACCVCLENEESVWTELDCKHKLHVKCWIKMKPNNRCPLCRVVTAGNGKRL